MRFRRIALITAAVLTAALATTSITMVSQADEPNQTTSKAGKPDQMKATEVFEKGQRGYYCFRIPTIIKVKGDDLLAFAEARRGDCKDHGHHDLVQRRSTDGGKSWKDMKIVTKPRKPDFSNPAPVFDKNTGRLTLLSTKGPAGDSHDRTPVIQTSTNNGHKWSDPRSIKKQVPDVVGKHLAFGPGGAIQLTQGKHKGRLVIGVTFTAGKGSSAGLVFSDDGGKSWELGAHDRVTDGSKVPQELNLFETKGGGVYAMARDNGSKGKEPPRVFAISSDSGESFDNKFKHKKHLGGTQRVQGSVENVEGSNRTVFVAPVGGNERKNLMIRYSTDDGKTWQNQADGYYISKDRAGYSNIVSLNHKWVGVVWEGGDYPNGNANDAIWFTKLDSKDL